jgi:hypothetical protein
MSVFLTYDLRKAHSDGFNPTPKGKKEKECNHAGNVLSLTDKLSNNTRHCESLRREPLNFTRGLSRPYVAGRGSLRLQCL